MFGSMDSSRLYFGQNTSNLFLGYGDHFPYGQRSIQNTEEPSRRRPYSVMMDDMLDDEFYDEQTPEKKRRLSPEQVHMLEKSFDEDNKLEPERKTELAKKLGLQPRQVAVWFQNRRARWKTKQLERDYDRLKSSYDSLVSDYDSISKETEKLRAEVLSLTEMLQSKEVAGVVVSNSPVLEAANVPALALVVKMEDHLSAGTSGSTVVDDQEGRQLVDSGDSYLPNEDYAEYAAHVDQSEEDDGSDDGRSYFSHAWAGQPHHEEEPMGWWVWS